MHKYINITQQGPLNHDPLLPTFFFFCQAIQTHCISHMSSQTHFRQPSRETSSLWKTESMFLNICCLIWMQGYISLALFLTGLVMWLSLANEIFTNVVCHLRAADLRTIMRSGLPVLTIPSFTTTGNVSMREIYHEWEINLVICKIPRFGDILQCNQAPVDQYI